MALRQLPRATCRNLHRPTLSLLSIYASSASSPLPPSFLLPSTSHDRLSSPAHLAAAAAAGIAHAQQRRYVATGLRYPVAPNLGPQFIGKVRVRYPYDGEITALSASLIGGDGKLVGIYPLAQILQSYDTQKYHLIHLSNPDGLPDESDGHVVRLFTKESLQARAEEERKEKETRKKSKKAGGGGSVAVKEIQISWGIDSHDLTHRLERAGKFLEKGNRVELMIAKKKGQSKVTPERLQEVMDVIEEFMYYNGGASVRKQEGEVGAQIKMWLQRPADWVRPPPKVEGAEAAEGVVGEGMRAEGDAAGEGVVEEGGVGEVDGGQGEQQQQQQGHVPAWRSKSEVVW